MTSHHPPHALSASALRLPAAFIALLALSLLLALAPLSAQAAPLQVPDTLAQRALACTACHGKEGRATSEGYFPRIAGKPAGYLHNQLLNFRDGRRRYALMTHLLEHLSDDYLREMAVYFASLDLPYPPPQTRGASPEVLARGEALALRGDAARGVPSCVACHGSQLMGVNPGVPGLLGLPRDYINGQLGAWQTGQRRAHAPDCMARIARELTPQDISAVSTWLSSQPVPPGAKPAPPSAEPLPIACGGLK